MLDDSKKSLMEKKKINDVVYRMLKRISSIKEEISSKYNTHIMKQLEILEVDQKEKIIKYINALSKT